MVIQKLHIDDGCLGGGGSISATSEYSAYANHFSSDRKTDGIFKYCVFSDDKNDGNLAKNAFSVRGTLPGKSVSRHLKQNLLKYCTWLDLTTDSDGDMLPDIWEEFMGTDPDSSDGDENEKIGFRVIKIYDDRMVTKMYHLYEDELRLYSEDDARKSGISAESKVLYPSSGCPAIIRPGDTLKICVDANNDDITSIELVPSFGAPNPLFPNIIRLTADENNPACSITVQTYSHYPIGFYDLIVHGKSNWRSSHSVQIIDDYKDCTYKDGKTDTPLTIVQVTDMHIGEGKGHNTNVDRFMAVINRVNEFINPDFVFVTGDMTESGKADEMKYFKDSLLQCNVPMFCTPGNHDHRDNGETLSYSHVGCINYKKYISPAFFDDPEEDDNQWMHGFFDQELHCPGLDYAFDYGNFHFISFDSGPGGIDDSETNGLTTGQLDWIKWSQEEAADRGIEHSFIFTHGPFCGHNEDGKYSHDQNDGDFISWANGLSTNPIEATFHGHTHHPWIFHNVSSSNYDGVNVPHYSGTDPWLWSLTFLFSRPIYYIESDDLKG